jgi:hypothetical protein
MGVAVVWTTIATVEAVVALVTVTVILIIIIFVPILAEFPWRESHA